MKQMETVLLLLFLVKKSSELLEVPEKEVTSPISECVLYILNKYFAKSTKISIDHSKEQGSIVADITRNFNLPIVLNADEMHNSEKIDDRTPNDVSIIMDKSANIFEFLNATKWTATTQFLVVTNISQTSEQKMIEVFQKFWVNNIVNVLLLAADNADIYIHTFMPFNPYDCAVHKPVLLATWTLGRITPNTEIIQKERVTNLNGCTLNASVVNLPPVIILPNKESKNSTPTVEGVEGSILNEIAKKLNFKLNPAEPKDNGGWGWVQPKPKGAVGEVFLKKSHFACGIFSYTLERYAHLDMSVPIGCGRECFSWAVPMGAKKVQPAWISLLIAGFHDDLWYLIFTVITCIMISFRILSKISEIDRYLFSGDIKIIFYTFKSSLGASVEEVPKSLSLKILFLTWLLYCFVIITAYQALLGSKLTVPQKQRNINTFKDLLESDLRITGLKSSLRFIKDAEEEKDINAIGNLYEEVTYGFKEAIDKLVHEKNLAYMWTATTFMYNVMSDPEAKGLIHFMKQCVYEYYSVLVLQKNCPFTARVNQIIRALVESGIICKWRKKYVYDLPRSDPPVQKLTLNRMIGSFVILIIGLSTALVVFLAEQFIYWFSSRKIKTMESIQNSATKDFHKL